MLYKPSEATDYLEHLNQLEEAHQQAIHEATGIFLDCALAVGKGSVVEVAPNPKLYFSRARRFLVLSVTAHVARSKDTGKFAGVIPALIGVFLRDNGEPIQQSRVERQPGEYHTESLAMSGSRYLAAPIEKLAEDQYHTVDLA